MKRNIFYGGASLICLALMSMFMVNSAFATPLLGETGGSPNISTITAIDTIRITGNTDDSVNEGVIINSNGTAAASSSISVLTTTGVSINSTIGTAITGTTSINASNNAVTNINTGTSTSAVTIGNSANATYINSATNNIGVNAFATANNIGTGSAASTNTIGNTTTTTTVNSYAGAGYTTLNNTTSTMGTNAAGDNTTGGMVKTNATTATIRASNSGTMATNGSDGTMVIGAGGGYTAYNAAESTGTNTIGHVVDSKSYTNKINGSLYVDGNVYINGTLDYVSSNSANTTVVGSSTGTSNLVGATTATSAGTAIVMKGSTGSQTEVDVNGKLTNTAVGHTATESTASLTLTNGLGQTHGIVITETQTTISGGRSSSAMTLHDDGATFSNTSNGEPVRVHGVDDGLAPYDAVNVRQLGAGLAMVAGLAALPQVEPGKRFAIGVGTGGYMSQVSIAGGISARFLERFVVKGGCAFVPGYDGHTVPVWNAGLQYSF
ncbi:MAG: YadA-like family protein [Deltaproteobacteria bacterium]